METSYDYAAFITVDEGDTLKVSFAVGHYAQDTLSFFRVAKDEHVLPPAEQGVRVFGRWGYGSTPEYLRALRWTSASVRLTTSKAKHDLDLSDVLPDDIKRAKRMLQRMNFDGWFEMTDE